MAEHHLVAVHARVQVVTTSRDLGVDEPASVRVPEGSVGDGDLRDLRKLRVPELLHASKVFVEAAGADEGSRLGPRVVSTEAPRREDIVVVDRAVRSDGVGSSVEWHHPLRGFGICDNRGQIAGTVRGCRRSADRPGHAVLLSFERISVASSSCRGGNGVKSAR